MCICNMLQLRQKSCVESGSMHIQNEIKGTPRQYKNIETLGMRKRILYAECNIRPVPFCH